MRQRDVAEVVIAGAGPVGLALAMELGRRGVSVVVVESRDRSRLVPRAKLANVRTMEHMRRWGVADLLRTATPLPAEYSTDVAFVTSVLGHEITRFSNAFCTLPDAGGLFSEPAQQVPQYVLEPILREAAERVPSVSFLEGWRVETFEDRRDEVEVGIRQGDEVRSIAAQYLVGCDGGGSTVRSALGVAMVGRRGIARNYGVVFRAPELSAMVPFAPALHFWTINPNTPSYMGPADRHGLWWLQATAIDPSVNMETLDPVDVVCGALGTRLRIEVVNVDPWDAHALTAERVREGRVFLAGDAAHLHSPMGAHGMNQGIGDAVDLGWKLAAVLGGYGGAGLLDSYAAERGPLHARVTQEATHNYGALSNHFVRPGLGGDGPAGRALRADLALEIQHRKRREFYSLGLVLGHVYENSPVVVPDGRALAAQEVETFTPRATPGGRAPHAWLRDGSSLFDHVGPGFTLLRLGSTGVDPEPLVRASRERGIPFDVVDVDDPHVAERYATRLALLRTDHVLVWHGNAAPDDPGEVLDIVTGRTERRHS